MKICPHCHVSIYGNTTVCPLCGGELAPAYSVVSKYEVDKSPAPLPRELTVAATDITKKQPPLFIRILLGMLVGVMAVGFAGVFYHSAGWWLVYVGASIVVAWGTLFILKNIYSERLAEHVFYANACHCGIALVADKLLGLGNCALNFILPILGLTTLVAVMVSAALKQDGEKEHLFYLLLNTLVAAVMAFLLVFGVITIAIPTIVYGIVSMIALVVFAVADPKALVTILARKIHI